MVMLGVLGPAYAYAVDHVQEKLHKVKQGRWLRCVAYCPDGVYDQ